MVDQVKKPWKHPPIRNPNTGEAGQWQEVSGRSIFIPDSELDPAAIGDAEIDRWEHPPPAYQAEGEEDENPNREIEKEPLPNNNQEIDKIPSKPGQERIDFNPRLETEDRVGEVLMDNKDSPTGYGDVDMGFVQGRGENDIDARHSETYIGSAGNRSRRKINMNKISHTKVGDDIHFYVNGEEDRGIVVKMGNTYIQVFKEDGKIYDIHINDTFYVKDILINKTWNDMDSTERYVALQKIHAPSPRFIMKEWDQLPKEIKELLTKTGWTYEPGTSKDAESQDHDRTGMQQQHQYKKVGEQSGGEIDPSIETETEPVGSKEREGSSSHISHGIGNNSRYKTDVELQQGRDEPLLGGVSTIEEPLDAEEDYEGQTHDTKEEQFKHKESEYDAATGQRKGLAAVGLRGKEDSPGFNAIYGQSGGSPGTDEKYGGKKSGTVGVPDYNKNSFGIKYVKTKAGKFWCEQHQAWETEQTHNQPPSGVGR